MEQLATLAIIGVAIGVLYFGGFRAAEATQTAFEGYFRGYQPDPWPHGVQEQDIERHWDADSGRRSGGPSSGDDSGRHSAGQPEPEVTDVARFDGPRVRIQPVRDYRVHSHV